MTKSEFERYLRYITEISNRVKETTPGWVTVDENFPPFRKYKDELKNAYHGGYITLLLEQNGNEIIKDESHINVKLDKSSKIYRIINDIPLDNIIQKKTSSSFLSDQISDNRKHVLTIHRKWIIKFEFYGIKKWDDLAGKRMKKLNYILRNL